MSGDYSNECVLGGDNLSCRTQRRLELELAPLINVYSPACREVHVVVSPIIAICLLKELIS